MVQLESRTYNWQYQPQIIWKGHHFKNASFQNTRPETNGSWILSKQQMTTDGNAFLPRPIKHWRKQLMSNQVRGGTKNVTLNDINGPGLYTMLNNTNSTTSICCDMSNNSSSIISNIQIKNSNIYDNSETKVSYIDISNCWNFPFGKRICCNPENNLITYKTTPLEKNFITYSSYFKYKCYNYNQNMSTTKVKGNVYFNSNGNALYPTDLPDGCQVLQKKECSNDCCITNYGTNVKVQNMIYKPNNRTFAKQGATTGKSRINRLRENTLTQGGGLYNSASGLKQINNDICNINGDSVYYIKTRTVDNSCKCK
jgi:hypothetical protein